jgi:nucleotide-binding universal stress UspA family protein
MSKKILVPIDGSSCSIRAAKYAIEAAKLQKAQIFCIHVIGSLPYGYGSNGYAVQQYFDDAESQAKSWFKKVNDVAINEGVNDVKTDVFTTPTSITNSIINYAEDKSVDLIVIGTRGRTGIKRFLLGSIAQGVVRHAHCPVLIVNQKYIFMCMYKLLFVLVILFCCYVNINHIFRLSSNIRSFLS